MFTSPAPLTDIDLPLDDRRDGKVRVSYSLPNGHRLFVTTDRLSAFDRVIASVPYKGQVLNQLSAWWFEQTRDIVANHVVLRTGPERVDRPQRSPAVGRGGGAGLHHGVTDTALWTQYAAGARVVYGHELPDGLTKNSRLDTPIVTPTTKAEHGGHDVPLSCADVAERGLVDPDLWDRVQDVALALFERGRASGERSGLILADTKYEFGLTNDGELLLIDEVHTPDSSRWWVASTYDERVASGAEPESLDKEVVRRALADTGYTGEGPVPELPPTVWSATTARYIDAYERLTGSPFVPGNYPAGPRIVAALAGLEIYQS